ncbi:hypothetical protein [Nocardioides yefusunii]|uniref:Uncharacterized protein n=1 Tax=Nocardioides yefusunii TaxID=2500546 RepID=A0ABW1QW17_9ACTN|nr:hypothetical protein [Nocardioides yefusunii]
MTHTTSRRALLQTAAWSAPAISLAATAPAFASSTCTWTSQKVTMASFAPVTFTSTAGATVSTSTSSALASGAVAPEPVTVSVKTTFEANSAPTKSKHLFKFPESGNLAQTAGAPAALRVNNGDKMLKFAMERASGASSPNELGMTVTVGFSPAVTNLQFTITDIDSNGTNQYDKVWLTSVNKAAVDFSTIAASIGSFIDPTSLGTSAKPWQTATNSGSLNAGDSSSDANVRINFRTSEPISEITFVYRNAGTSASATTLNIADLSFDAPQYSGC